MTLSVYGKRINSPKAWLFTKTWQNLQMHWKIRHENDTYLMLRTLKL